MEKNKKIALIVIGVIVLVLLIVGIAALIWYLVDRNKDDTTMPDIKPTDQLSQLLKGQIKDKSIGTSVASEIQAARLSAKISDMLGKRYGEKMKENALVSVLSLNGQTGVIEIGLFVEKDNAIGANDIKGALDGHNELTVEKLEMVETTMAQVTYSKTILMVSRSLSASLDLSTLPCTDFNKFSCANWKETIPGLDTPAQSYLQMLQFKVLFDLIEELDKMKVNDAVPRYYRQMKIAYDMCSVDKPSGDQLDKDKRKAFFADMIKRIGGFPAIQKGWQVPANGVNIAGVVGKSFALAGLGASPVELVTFADNNNPDIVVPLLTLSSSISIDEAMIRRLAALLNDGDSSINEADKRKITKMYTELGSLLSALPPPDVSSTTEPYLHAPNPELFADYVDFAAAGQQVPGFNFRAFFDAMKTNETPGYDPSGLNKFYIIGKDRLSAVVTYLKKQEQRDIQNVLASFVATFVGSMLPDESRATSAYRPLSMLLEKSALKPVINPRTPLIAEEPTLNLTHLSKLANANQLTCLAQFIRTSSPLKDAFGRFYVEKVLAKEDFKILQSMIPEITSKIREGFVEMLEGVDWLEATSKAATVEKIKSISTTLVIGNWSLDDAKLNEYTRKVQLDAGDDFYTNSFKIAKYVKMMATNCFLEQIGQKLDRNYYTASATVNAWMNAFENSVNIPAAIMQPPFYHLSTDMPLHAVTYGAIGTVIGHEFGHGFDTGGVFWKLSAPRLTNDPFLSDKNTFERFKNERQCMVDKYANVSGINLPIHLVYTNLNQGYADLAGLQSSFRAFQNQSTTSSKTGLAGPLYMFSTDQMFFVSWGHAWCSTDALTGPWRTNAAFQSFPTGFADSFKCASPSGMRPAKHCSIWSK